MAMEAFWISARSGLRMSLVSGGMMAVGFWCFLHNQTSALVAAAVLIVLLILFRLQPILSIYAALIFLALEGDIRRVVSGVFGFPANDPIILVGAAYIFLIVAPMLLRMNYTDPATKCMYFLILIQLVQVVNPGQGGIGVGLSGILLLTTPLLWFWVGRRWGSEDLLRTVMYQIALWLGLLAATYGYYQTLFGPLPWQLAWVQHLKDAMGGVGALSIGSQQVRSFGFSTFSSEYTNLLAFAASFCVAGAMSTRRVLLLPLAYIIPALILASSRGAILKVLIFACLAWALKSRGGAHRTLRLVIAFVLAFGGLALLLSRVGDYKVDKNSSQADFALAHNANGLAHPLDNKASSAGIHGAEIMRGFVDGIKRPIGYGVGSTTAGAAKFGGRARATEFEITDNFIGLGLPGGLLFAALTYYVFATGFKFANWASPDIALPITAYLLPSLGNWSYQGEYFTGPLFWLLVGTMVRLQVNHEKARRLADPKKIRQSDDLRATPAGPNKLGVVNA